MDKQKTISIRMNGKETIIPSENKARETFEDSYKEQAATLDSNYDPDDLIEYEKRDTSDTTNWYDSSVKKQRNRKLNPSAIKTFAVAGVSATLIGLTLGFILLRLFVGIGEDGDQTATSDNANTDTPTTTTDDAGSETGTDTSSEVGTDGSLVAYTIDPMQAFVIQAGVFSTVEKAETWQTQFTEAAFPSMVWEHEGQFRLFAGLFATEQSADIFAEQMTASGLEPYVRPWQTEATAIELSSEVEAWISAFPALWQESLKEIGNASALATDWQTWVDKYPAQNAEQLQGVQQASQQLIASLSSGAETKQLQIELLQLWEQYSGLVKQDS
ncbi:SPOR domain-containing protein [Radiobacillus sp. PE A8.2]|uniref:SPOR domain-containing protein n=1 Tax=Radiobacillus sp. PE A8.2 TaxID=3380349 RepID=UPI00388F88B6